MDKKTSDTWFKFGLLTFWSLFMYGLGAKDIGLLSSGLGFMVLMFVGDWVRVRMLTGSPDDTDR
jgi:uncharacterized membrane protein